MALLSFFLQMPILRFLTIMKNGAVQLSPLIMFGLCPNILSLLQFSLVFISLCQNFVVLFLPEFPSNQLQTLAQ